MLLLRAIARAAPYLEAYDIETARSKDDVPGVAADKKVKSQLRAVLDMARDSGASAFDEKALFKGDDALVSRGVQSRCSKEIGRSFLAQHLFDWWDESGTSRSIQAQL